MANAVHHAVCHKLLHPRTPDTHLQCTFTTQIATGFAIYKPVHFAQARPTMPCIFLVDIITFGLRM